MIGSTAFGILVDSQGDPDNEFTRMANKATEVKLSLAVLLASKVVCQSLSTALTTLLTLYEIHDVTRYRLVGVGERRSQVDALTIYSI